MFVFFYVNISNVVFFHDASLDCDKIKIKLSTKYTKTVELFKSCIGMVMYLSKIQGRASCQ